MPTQSDKAATFRALHVKGDPLVLYNIWDPGSADVVAQAGAKALATGSAPVAMAQGYPDGEGIPLEQSLANVARVVERTDLPVSLDLEGGYSVDPEGINDNAKRALATGVVGFNFEDQVVGTEDLYEIPVQIERVAAMRAAIDDSGTNAFLNGRTDIFLKTPRDRHERNMLRHATERARAYMSAGADGFFVPGLVDPALIETLCASVTVPVNVIALPGCPPKSQLRDLGVARISHGPFPYRNAMATLSEAARRAFA